MKKTLAGGIAKLVDTGYADFFSGMAEGTDACLLTVYNGERRGGTAMTVRYAHKLEREVIVLDPVCGDKVEKSILYFISKIVFSIK